MIPVGLIFVALGMFAMCGAIFDRDSFMNGRKARFFVTILTRTGARIFCVFLGSGLMVFGILCNGNHQGLELIGLAPITAFPLRRRVHAADTLRFAGSHSPVGLRSLV